MSVSSTDALADLIAGRWPDAHGRFGPFGGRYVPETLVPTLERLSEGVREHLHAPDFQRQFAGELSSWVGRPTALTYAARLSEEWGAKIWLKREDLAHTGAHKINNALGQALLARRLGARFGRHHLSHRMLLHADRHSALIIGTVRSPWAYRADDIGGRHGPPWDHPGDNVTPTL